jgi:hypothetical protein
MLDTKPIGGGGGGGEGGDERGHAAAWILIVLNRPWSHQLFCSGPVRTYLYAICFVFCFHSFPFERVIDMICNISWRSNDRLSVPSLSSVLLSAVAVLSASRIIKYTLFQRERDIGLSPCHV